MGLAAAAALLVSLLVSGVTKDRRPEYVLEEDEVAGAFREVIRGARALFFHPALRLSSATMVLLFFFEGFIEVMVVVMALEMLHLSQGAVGFLNATIGVGAVLGAIGLAMLFDRGRLVPAIAGGSLLIGAATMLPGIAPHATTAYAGMLAIGFGFVFAEVATKTLMQRLGSDETFGRVIGAFESARQAALAPDGRLGSLQLAGELHVGGRRLAPLRSEGFRRARPRRPDARLRRLLDLHRPAETGRRQNLRPRTGRRDDRTAVPGGKLAVAADRLQTGADGLPDQHPPRRRDLTASKGSSGELQSSHFWCGVLVATQDEGDNQIVGLKLAGRRMCERRGGSKAPTARISRGGTHGRRLWGSGKGNYTTSGSYGSATVRGTTWLVIDRCDSSTLIKVAEGTVAVRDFVKDKSLILTTGEQYLAKAQIPRINPDNLP